MDERLLAHVRALRRNMTKQEKRLWFDFLQKVSHKWYKQKVLGPYILDFYCPALRLAVEVDGGQHYQENGLSGYDQERTRFLEKRHILVWRVTNAEIDRSFDAVCEACRSIMNRLEATYESGV